MWFILALVSALFLGFYDVFKKVSVSKNAVLPVLMTSTASSALIFVPLIALSRLNLLPVNHILYTPEITTHEHILILIKAIIVLTSWIFSFFAIKHLPLTVVAPIRATGPLWTLIGAILIFNEQLNGIQWTGIIITLLFFYLIQHNRKTGRH